ncbi:LysR substrate-binding domain-containing protein, partial [Psychrobacter sp. FBL11]
LYREARDILQPLANLEQRIGDDPAYAGIVRLMSPGSVGLKLYQQLLTLQQQYPHLVIDYRFAPNSDIERAVANHDIDLGFMTEISDDEGISCQSIAQEA